jgi:hypothetical protein
MGFGMGLMGTGYSRMGAAASEGLPGWMASMDLGWDFARNIKYRGAVDPTDTHSATIYAQSAAGVWSPFAANTLVQTDLGLQTVPTRTNLVVRSNDQSNAAWVITGGSSVGAPVLSPNGGTDAYPITFAASSVAGLTQNLTGMTASTTYTASLWVRCVSGTELVRIKVWDNTSDKFSSNITVTTAWQRVTFTLTTGATTPTTPNIEIRNASDGLARTVLVYQAQLEAGAFATPPIVTTSSSATVNGNQQVVDLTGRLSAGVGGIIQANVLETGSVVSRLLEINDGASSTNALVAYLEASSNQIVFQTVVGGANTMLIYPEANAGATGVMTIAFAASSNYLMVQVIGKTTPAAITSGSYPSGMSKFGFFGRGYDSQRNAYALTRRAALRFGAQNATTFADLVAKATILNAVS